uniref:Decapping nuclease n=1 Tax=Caenorhabditis tropicalis TaxID=1561998 RepID=A0A1I7UH00_9PELO
MSESEREAPKIYVDTIGYYHADIDFEATPNLLPKRFNSNRMFFDNPNIPIPFVDVSNKDHKNHQIKEYNLISFLRYLNQKGWPDGRKPHFVTHKQLLQSIATGLENEILYLVRINGIIFMFKQDSASANRVSLPFSWMFRQFLTRESPDEPIDTSGIIQKGVFRASIETRNGRRTEVLYAGKVDAIDDENIHYGVKVIAGFVERVPFFQHRGVSFYWQAFFENVKYMILAERTGFINNDWKTRPPTNYPQYSVYKVLKMKLTNFYSETNSFIENNPSLQQFEKGYEDLRHLLNIAEQTLTQDGDGFVFSKPEGNSQWKIRRDDKAVAEFRRLILMNIPD